MPTDPATASASAPPTCLPPTADLVVVGAGVVGCATAFRAARAGLRTVVLDARPRPATLTTPAATGAYPAPVRQRRGGRARPRGGRAVRATSPSGPGCRATTSACARRATCSAPATRRAVDAPARARRPPATRSGSTTSSCSTATRSGGASRTSRTRSSRPGSGPATGSSTRSGSPGATRSRRRGGPGVERPTGSAEATFVLGQRVDGAADGRRADRRGRDARRRDRGAARRPRDRAVPRPDRGPRRRRRPDRADPPPEGRRRRTRRRSRRTRR